MNDHCVLMKFDTPEEAFRYMGGIYHTEEFGEFGILDDDNFPDYIIFNAVYYIGRYLKGRFTKERLDMALATDINGVMTVELLGYPFLLYSKKLGSYYGFHFDSDLMDLTDNECGKYYSELVVAYDFPSLVETAKKMIKSDMKTFRKNPRKIDFLLIEIAPTIREL